MIIDYLIFSIGALVVLLSFLSLIFGKKIDNDGDQIIIIGERIKIQASKIIIFFALGLVTCISPKIIDNYFPSKEDRGFVVDPIPANDVLSFCKDFEGDYHLAQKYIFFENQDKETRTSLAPWHSRLSNAKCKMNGETAELKGQVSSLFTLEAKIDNRYKPIAYIFYNYDSWVDINHNKDFVHRYFGDLEQKYIEHKNTERDLTKVIANSKKNCPKQLEPNKKFLDDLHYGEELICLNNETGLDEKQQKKLVESAILEYKKAFESIQNRIPCDVTYGKIGKDKKLALVFICEGFDHSQGYTRVMKKFR